MKQFRSMTYPYVAWIAVMIVAPMLLIVLYAFTESGNDVLTFRFTAGNFVRFVTDRVFLLSINEAYAYFATNEARACRATPYEAAKDTWYDPATVVDGYVECDWWLRSPGSVPDKAPSVVCEGWVELGGGSVNSIDAVRPALWLTDGE